jgi:phenylalanyl-tRNA synthetase beta chain
VAEDASQLPSKTPIRLRADRVERLLGKRFEDDQITEILRRLGMELTGGAGTWQVLPPTFRFDISMEDDLIEEVGRVYGYARLPSSRPLARLGVGERPEAMVVQQRIRTLMVDRGFHEAITYSFVEPELQASLDPEQTPIPLANPISSEMSVMRTSMLPGLVGAMRYNLSRQQGRVRLFEIGLVFRQVHGETLQTPRLGVLVSGEAQGEQWGLAARPVDFYDLKGEVEALTALGGRAGSFALESARHPALHPGRSARVLSDGEAVGWIGALHPDIERRLDLGKGVYVLEVDLQALTQGRVPAFSELSRFPAIRRDLALVLDESITAESLVRCIREIDSELIRDIQPFDVYRGEGVDAGRKSLAMGLILQADSRTLTDEEVEGLIQRVVEHIGARLGAELRK